MSMASLSGKLMVIFMGETLSARWFGGTDGSPGGHPLARRPFCMQICFLAPQPGRGCWHYGPPKRNRASGIGGHRFQTGDGAISAIMKAGQRTYIQGGRGCDEMAAFGDKDHRHEKRGYGTDSPFALQMSGLTQ
jgi:hypothetical protein